jgi:polyhydroxybutyrate depolymerase
MAGVSTRGVLVVGLMVLLAFAASACGGGEGDRDTDQATTTARPSPSAQAQASATAEPSATAQPSPIVQPQALATAQPSPSQEAQASPTAMPSPTEQPQPTVTATAGSGYPAGTSIQEIESGGQTRQYRVHIPPSYQSGTPMSLVLNLHGLNETAAQQEALSGMSAKADSAGFIVVYPEGIDQTWHIGPGPAAATDMQFIRDLVAELQSRLSIDPARIYAAGISNGAQMSNLLGCNASDIIAAIGPVSGGYSPAQECAPGRPVPVVGFHGTADQLIPYEGDAATQGRLLMPAKEWAAAWAARNGCSPTPAVTYQGSEVTGETWSGCREGADVVFYTIEGGGHGWPGASSGAGVTTNEIDATDIIWEFFAAHPVP